jgi:hypothetical protein
LVSSKGQRVYDRFRLSGQPWRLPSNPEHNPLIITLTRPTLFINGNFAADSGGVEEAAGKSATIDVPGRGRFVLTLDAHADPRFVAAGSAQGNSIEFQFGPDRFRVECSAPVTVGARVPIYAYFKPDATIRRPQFATGGASVPPR